MNALIPLSLGLSLPSPKEGNSYSIGLVPECVLACVMRTTSPLWYPFLLRIYRYQTATSPSPVQPYHTVVETTQPSIPGTAMHSHLVRAYWSNLSTDSWKPIAMDATITDNKFICIAPNLKKQKRKTIHPDNAQHFSLLVLRVHPPNHLASLLSAVNFSNSESLLNDASSNEILFVRLQVDPQRAALPDTLYMCISASGHNKRFF